MSHIDGAARPAAGRWSGFVCPEHLTDNRSIALALAEAGVAVFPCRGGTGSDAKQPCPGVKWQDVRPNPGRVEQWWKLYPDAMPAIHTRQQRILFVDLDGATGIAQWDELCRQRGYQHQGPRTFTPGGGIHIPFRLPEGVHHGNGLGGLPKKKKGGCIDIRGPGEGYVISPGTETADNRFYEPEGGDNLDFLHAPVLPDWLLELLASKAPEQAAALPCSGPDYTVNPQAGARVEAWAEAAFQREIAAVANCGAGARNLALNTASFSLAQLVAGGFLDRGRVHAALVGAAAASGLLADDGRRSVEATIASGLRGGLAKPRTPPVDLENDDAAMEALGRSASPVLIQAANGELADAETGELPGLQLTDPSTLAGKPLAPREWIVPDWLGCGYTTMLYGDGGTGKTLLLHQLMTSCATGIPWLGMAVTRCRVFALFCEDDEQELHRRQAAICTASGLPWAALGDMRWHSGVGQDNLLATFDREGRLKLTRRYHDVLAAAQGFGAKLVVIDTAADTFGGNENDRSQVRQYIGALTRMAREVGGAVLLNAHPSRSGMGLGGDMDGGSTAWSNSARARWSLAHTKTADNKPDGSGRRVLTRRKANYSSIGATMDLTYANGVLGLIQPPTALERMARDAAADRVFMDCLRQHYGRGDRVSKAIQATNYAPKLFAGLPAAEGLKKDDLAAAMWRLIDCQRVIEEEYGRSGDLRRCLAPCDDPVADASSAGGLTH